ncbi:MAG TPA: sodium:proton antiporter [Arachnia sp.]|nr:sodium:proton antiporter [Arachnia sp.]
MTYPWWSMLPFVALLACIAILPLLHRTAHLWEKWSTQLGLALVLGIPVAAAVWALDDPWRVGHALYEYVQFIALLLALFVVSGGLFLKGDIEATPRNNTTFLGIGALVASFVGTTGAAMLLIRPLLNTNQERKHRVHTALFAIFIVANSGGLLTPLGDPPLFLGLLRGVPFTWTFGLWPHWLFVNALMLFAYYALDRRIYATEAPEDVAFDRTNVTPLGVRGKINFLWFAVIIAAVAFAPSMDLHAIEAGHATAASWIPVRELVMLAVVVASMLTTAQSVRYGDNEFSWGPIAEVAALFVGIFLTMIPALEFLGQQAPKLPLNEITFFLFTGGLSSVLDNAPTYATFYEMASQLPPPTGVAMIGTSPPVPETFLVSISLGAVFCGALTYIGNGPNFMVKSVAESRGLSMPSFGGYVVRSFQYLAPTLLAMMLLMIADHWAAWVAGAAVVVWILARAVLDIRRSTSVPVSPVV